MPEKIFLNQKIKRQRAINLIKSFMTTFGKNERIIRILEPVKQGQVFWKSPELSYHSCRKDLAIIHLFNMTAVKVKIH